MTRPKRWLCWVKFSTICFKYTDRPSAINEIELSPEGIADQLEIDSALHMGKMVFLRRGNIGYREALKLVSRRISKKVRQSKAA